MAYFKEFGLEHDDDTTRNIAAETVAKTLVLGVLYWDDLSR